MNEEIKFRSLPPVWFISILNAFRRFLLSLNKRLFPANVVLYEHFQYFWLLPCLKVAAELDIAGILKDAPKTIKELSGITNTDEESLFRILRALSGNGIFRQLKSGQFINSPMSKALIDGNGSLRYMVLHHLGKVNWGAFSELSHTVRTKENAFLKIHQKNIYDYLAENEEESSLFDHSMTNLSILAVEPILSAYDFSSVKTIADIGGGEGLLLSAVLYKHRHASGILFDLPEALINAGPVFDKYNVRKRISVTPGSFFDVAPVGCDLYLLKNIIHNWSDKDCIRILSNIRNILPLHGKILVIEMIVKNDNHPSFGKLLDIQMMVTMQDGKERTREEFDSIVSAAGLKIRRIIPTIAPFSIIEIAR